MYVLLDCLIYYDKRTHLLIYCPDENALYQSGEDQVSKAVWKNNEAVFDYCLLAIGFFMHKYSH